MTITLAKRSDKKLLLKPKLEIQKEGLRYQKRVAKILKNTGCQIEVDPCFSYSRGGKEHFCFPDILVHEPKLDRIIVIEVKLSYTPQALTKLKSLYIPIVGQVFGQKAYPLVIVRSAVPGEIGFHSSLKNAIFSPNPVYLWPGYGPIT